MKIGDIVRIRDIDANKEMHRGLICLVISIQRLSDYHCVCILQNGSQRLGYHEERLEKINDY